MQRVASRPEQAVLGDGLILAARIGLALELHKAGPGFGRSGGRRCAEDGMRPDCRTAAILRGTASGDGSVLRWQRYLPRPLLREAMVAALAAHQSVRSVAHAAELVRMLAPVVEPVLADLESTVIRPKQAGHV